jgi:hypothetical protein
VDAKFNNFTEDPVHIEKHGKMLGITRRDRKRNTWVRSMTKVGDIAERVKKSKWTHSEKSGWQMDARNTGMVSERMLKKAR